MTNIVLLGASGFIGNSLLSSLEKERFKIKALVHNGHFENNVEKFTGDILRPGLLDKVVSNGDIIVNSIGQNNPSVKKFVDLNIKGGLNILESIKNKKNIRIILISSINVYGESEKKPFKENNRLQPITFYGIVKLLTEKLYKDYVKNRNNIELFILRLSNVYGPTNNVGIISNIINSLKNQKTIILNHKGSQYRDFIYIDDAITGIICAIKKKHICSNIFNISSGKKYRIKDVVKRIQKITGLESEIMLQNNHPNEKCLWADPLKAQKMLKFFPTTSLNQGLKQTISYNLN